jgi:hypothetical protein
MMLQLDLATLKADADGLEHGPVGNVQRRNKAEIEQLQPLIAHVK